MQTNEQLGSAARELGRRMFHLPHKTADLGTDDLIAAIASIDTAMDTVISTVPAPWTFKTIKQALIDNLPEPFKSKSTAQEKAVALTLWAIQESGL